MTISSTPALPETFAAFAETFETMAQAAVSRFSYDPSRSDITFGPHGELAALVRSATTLEGGLIEQGLRLLLDADPRFLVIEPVIRLPILKEAVAAVKSNDFKSLAKVRFDPKSYTANHYAPDLIVIDRARQLGHMLELKRCSQSFGKGYLKMLQSKMRAATLVLPHMLFYRGYPAVSDVHMQIVDCEDTDHRDLVVGTRDLDHTFDCPGLGAALDFLRHRFALAVQARIDHCIGGDDDRRGPDPAHDAVPDAFEPADRSAPEAAVTPAQPPALGAVTVTVGCKRGRYSKGSEAATSGPVPAVGEMSSSDALAQAPRTPRPDFPASISTGAIDPEHPGDDPATIIALALRMGLMGQVDGTRLPPALEEGLRELAEEGEPAAIMVRDWLDRVLVSKPHAADAA